MKILTRIKKMGTEGQALLESAEQALRNSLAGIPFVCNIEIRDNEKKNNELHWLLNAWNFEVVLSLRNGERIRIFVKSSTGAPRYIREAAIGLRQAKPDEYGIVIASYISETSAAICAEAGVGYIDFAGNCLLSVGNVYIRKSGAEAAPREKRGLRSLYYPKSERVLRVWLNTPRKEWKIKQLAAEAQVSIGQAHNVVEALDDKEYLIQMPGYSPYLDKKEPLLAEWAQNYQYDRNTAYNFYSLQSVHDAEYDLAEMCRREGISYALTGFSGAARYAFYAKYRNVTAYVDGDIGVLADQLNLKPVSDGANVTLLTPYDAGVFYGAEEVEGTKVVSPIQVYLDVSAMRGRGENTAKYLLEEVIRLRWQKEGI